MRISVDNGFGDLKGLAGVGYGIAALLAFILVVGAVTVAKNRADNHSGAGSEELVIPSSLA
jgi:hypothetical protein